MEIITFGQEVEKIIKKGGIGVLSTDTIYGLVGKALSKTTVSRIYRIKERKPDKPLIILIGSLRQLDLFGIAVDSKTQLLLNRFWPGKVSIILPCSRPDLEYLHRGTNSLAFRFPDYPELTNLINQTGPLVAPSANPEDLKPAKDIAQAKKYFSSKVDFYVNSGRLDSQPSTLISIKNGKIEVLREGAVKINA